MFLCDKRNVSLNVRSMYASTLLGSNGNSCGCVEPVSKMDEFLKEFLGIAVVHSIGKRTIWSEIEKYRRRTTGLLKVRKLIFSPLKLIRTVMHSEKLLAMFMPFELSWCKLVVETSSECNVY